MQDCDHVSQTAEEFYTVRCQVADMKNIYVSIQTSPITNTIKIFQSLFTLIKCNILQKRS